MDLACNIVTEDSQGPYKEPQGSVVKITFSSHLESKGSCYISVKIDHFFELYATVLK